MRAGLLVMLWLSFLTVVAVAGAVLLRACGLLMPLTAALPGPVWDFCPSAPPVLSAEAERDVALRQKAGQLELQLAQKALACASIPKPPPPPLELPTEAGRPRPQQTAQLKPPPPPPKPPAPPPPPPAISTAPLPADRWEQKDLSLLEGCWQLGRDALGNSSGEICTIKAGTICFGTNGTGRREATYLCPTQGRSTCAAPLTATFGSDGTLRTTQPATPCSDGETWRSKENYLTCRRVSDTIATCVSGLNFEYEFRRASP